MPESSCCLLLLLTILGIFEYLPLLRECLVPATAEPDVGRIIQTLTSRVDYRRLRPHIPRAKSAVDRLDNSKPG